MVYNAYYYKDLQEPFLQTSINENLSQGENRNYLSHFKRYKIFRKKKEQQTVISQKAVSRDTGGR